MHFGFLSFVRSQSSLDSTNSFAFVAPDLSKDPEHKSSREYRNEINVRLTIDHLFFLSDLLSIQMHEKFYDFLSEQYTFDHPLCQVRQNFVRTEHNVLIRLFRNALIHFQINQMSIYRWHPMNYKAISKIDWKIKFFV